MPRPTLADVDGELCDRFDWWLWVPEHERREYAEALVAGDEKRLAHLTKLGERRGFYRRDEDCYYAITIRDEAGEVVTNDGGHGTSIRLWGYRKDCTCLVTAILDDDLHAYLMGMPERRRVLNIGGTVAYVAQRLHDDPDWSITEWITVKKGRMVSEHAFSHEREFDEDPQQRRETSTGRIPLTSEVAASVPPAVASDGGTAEAPAAAPRRRLPTSVRRTPKWWDGASGGSPFGIDYS
jgi:hypothetical protein